jgi:hypothetical protein
MLQNGWQMGAAWVGQGGPPRVVLPRNEDIPALENSRISQILFGRRSYDDIGDPNILNFGFDKSVKIPL